MGFGTMRRRMHLCGSRCRRFRLEALFCRIANGPLRIDRIERLRMCGRRGFLMTNFIGKVFHTDFLSRRHDKKPPAKVFELANIPGERER